MTELVRIEGLWVEYGNLVILEGIDLVVEDGDFLGIIGPNGGGKTTLLKAVLGLIPPSRGKVRIAGMPPAKARRLIGYVPQYNLFDREFPMNVLETVLMGRMNVKGILHHHTEEDRELAREALRNAGMSGYETRQIGKLSGGEQQRVFIARALISRPKLLLLDEPTSGVDSSAQTDFYELLASLKKEMAIMMVSHDISAISVYVDKIACLNRKLHYHGSKEISAEVLEATYQCPVQMIAHGTIPHRVLKEH